MAAPADERPRPDEKRPGTPLERAPEDGAATWGGEGGAGDYRGGPTTSPGDAARDPGRDPEPA